MPSAFRDQLEKAMPPVGDVSVDAASLVDRRSGRDARRYPMVALKVAHSANRNWLQRFADRLIRIASSASFLAAHIAWFLAWIVWNSGLLGNTPFDPYPFGFLTLVVSLEAIFLAIFVLMGQSREAAIAELREELTLQVNLRMEAEVTKTLQLVAGLYTRLGHTIAEDSELREMLQALDAESIEKELLDQIRTAD